MVPPKLNEYLDAESSDGDVQGSRESDDAQESKGKRTIGLGNRSKSQKTSHESSDEESDEAHISEPDIAIKPLTNSTRVTPALAATVPINNDLPSTEFPSRFEPITSKPSKPKSKLATPVRSRKPGVVYLSRIPPFMRPSTVRHLLSPFGSITKLFLTPEPPSQHTSRVRSGGNKKRSFVDGWIEFASHKSAKTCVAAINGQTMGGRGWYRDDVWNAKYLRGFGWDDLMAGVRAEEREREERVRVGVRRDRKEREEFLKGVERAKVEEGKKRKRDGRREMEKGPEAGDEMGADEGKRKGFERRFRQNEVKKRKEVEGQPGEVSRVLSKIF
ncbi:MAG: hypothetical protein Q9166_003905 [cf. Caloplaca sp. 2 TL-2023]